LPLQRSAANPRLSLRPDRDAESCTLVIFGATGDLTRRKLGPALYNLKLDGLLPESLAVVGISRQDLTTEDFRKMMHEGIESHSRRPLETAAWQSLESSLSYISNPTGSPDDYARIVKHLDAMDERHGTGGRRLFYLAVPPSAFPKIVAGLGSAGLQHPARPEGWSRIVVEKPIGRDLESAETLNRAVNEVFSEQDVYRIDHYLGKETVQNLLVFRFANAIFEPLWNQKYLDHVQITVAESIGVEGRGKYFEEAGTTRDMVQNHLMQLLCLTAMEPPVSLDPDAIRDEKVKVLQSLRPVSPDHVRESTVRGQYARGVADGKEVPGYREEEGVASDSCTESYLALQVQIDNWRWAGVPFFLRAGKRMPRRVTEITAQFRDVPHHLFRSDSPAPNILALQVQPDEGISLRFGVKVPGANPRIRPVDMDFRYEDSFKQDAPDAYERLILDALLGDSTLFIRRDEVECSWAYIDRLYEGWALADPGRPLPEYTAGTWGPPEADILLAQGGRTWRRPQ